MPLPKVRHVDFYHDEWIAAVAGMRPEDQGVYWLVCALIYSSGGPIRADDHRLLSLSGCHGNRLRAIIARLKVAGKITRNGVWISQKRCEKELEKAQKRAENASENGRKHFGKRSEPGAAPSKNNSIQNLMGSKVQQLTLTTNLQPSTKEEESTPSPRRAGTPRQSGTNPRAKLTNPRAGGENPRSLGTNPRSERGSRIPDDWEPSSDDQLFARNLGLDPFTVADEFRDYWRSAPGAKARKLDWSATFRNRCRETAQRSNGFACASRNRREGSSILAAVSAIRAGREDF